MTDSNESSRTDLQESVLARKLASLNGWKKPIIEDTVGPFLPEYFEEYDQKQLNILEACNAKLATLSNEQIGILADRYLADETGIKEEWNDFRQWEISQLLSKPPFWFGGGLGHPDYLADFEYWSKMNYFTLLEASSLSVGVEPKHFALDALARLRKKDAHYRSIKPMAYLLQRDKQISRRFPKKLYGDRVPPKELFIWFEEVQLEIHPKFKSVYFHGSPAEMGRRKKSIQKEPDKREIDKIAQLFVAMAIDSLGYDPNAKRSPIPSEIVDIAASMGMEISEDTVRKYLRMGAGFLSESQKAD